MHSAVSQWKKCIHADKLPSSIVSITYVHQQGAIEIVLHTYVCTYICVYVHLCVHTYVCTYIGSTQYEYTYVHVLMGRRV